MKCEPSTKSAVPGIKENRFMTSSLQGPLEPDSKNTDQFIKTAVVNLLSWNFQRNLSYQGKTILWCRFCLVCKIHKMAVKNWKHAENDLCSLKFSNMYRVFVIFRPILTANRMYLTSFWFHSKLVLEKAKKPANYELAIDTIFFLNILHNFC